MKKWYTADELFPDRHELVLEPEGSRRSYSSFVDVRDLEWAKGSGLRCERKTRSLQNAAG